MFISRKRFEEMERRMEQLEYDIERLQRIHNYNDKWFYSPFSNIKMGSYSHGAQQAKTDLLGTITLQDIASLLIDNKPIIREDNVKVKKEFILK